MHKLTAARIYAQLKKRIPTFFILALALVATALLSLSHAASPAIILEPETAALNNVATAADAAASGGSYLQFGAGSTAANVNSVTVTAKGTTGAEIIQLLIRDQVVASWNLTTSFQAFSYTTAQSIGDSDIKVAFTNNGYYNNIDADAIIDFITVNGSIFQSEAPSTYSTGTYNNGNCTPGYVQSQTLNCNGYFNYSIGNAGTLPTTNYTTCGTTPQVTITPSTQSSLNGAPSTCYFLTNGSYNFHDIIAKDGTLFIGESPTGVVVDGTGYENAFSGNGKNVVISNFTLQNFNNDAGQSLQEQSPIRGTVGIWQTTDASQLATGWIIENMVIHDNIASGIFAGHDFTIKNNTIYNNGVTGIGGTRFYGGLFEGNNIYNNGASEQSGSNVNGGNIKVTYVNDVSSGVKKQLVITGNQVHDAKRGIWCDINCNNVLIQNNTVFNHSSTGIFYEISYNATISGNTVTNSSTWEDWPNDWNTGSIGVGESADVVVENNSINGGKSAVTLRQTARSDPGVTNLVLKNVTVRNNTINGATSIGVSQGTTGGSIAQYSTLTFSGNSYASPAMMSFYWQGTAQTYAQWQAAGRQ